MKQSTDMAHTAYITYYLALYRKSPLTSVLDLVPVSDLYL